ncbi:MAG TPA: hypothetical protein VH475_14190 [Tepidisphaeraceae bacterium]|jgi:hypothetical protein
MKWLCLVFMTLIACGCSSYTAAEIGLVGQARKGVAVWAGRESARDGEVKQSFEVRRKALDEAFDADVKRQAASGLDADWVIEARKAYAVGLAALAESESAALASNDAARRDAAATDDALAKLALLLSIQSEAESMVDGIFKGFGLKGGSR